MIRLPPWRPGMRIGLYGGSFDPPHPGHRHVAELALRRLRLDRVWWLVTPGNPLKDRTGLADAAERREATARVARHPQMIVTDLETALGITYTVETLRYLVRRCPGVRFVFIMGADSWAGFHRWHGWREIARRVAIAVIDRPGWTLRATAAPAPRALAARRWLERDAPSMVAASTPAWVLLHGPRSHLSSTSLRAKRVRGATAIEIGAGRLLSSQDIRGDLPRRRNETLTQIAVRAAASAPEMSPTHRDPTEMDISVIAAPAGADPSAPGEKPASTSPIAAPVTDGTEAAAEIRAATRASLEDMKAEDTVEIDLVGRTSIADAMFITSGRSNRHVGSIAEKLVSDLKEKGFPKVRVEGMPACDWVLIDAGDIIVHVFRPEVRGFYNLEKMWGVDRPVDQAAG